MRPPVTEPALRKALCDAARTVADRDGTRLSDFMPDHLRAFATASGAARTTAAPDRE